MAILEGTPSGVAEGTHSIRVIPQEPPGGGSSINDSTSRRMQEEAGRSKIPCWIASSFGFAIAVERVSRKQSQH